MNWRWRVIWCLLFHDYKLLGGKIFCRKCRSSWVKNVEDFPTDKLCECSRCRGTGAEL